MICIPITARSESGMAAMMAQAAPLADLLELRMDLAPGIALEPLLRNRPRPVIVTNRPVREGGEYAGEESARMALLQQAVDLGAEYVDVELDSVGRIRRGPRTRLIVSHHDFTHTPEHVEEMHRHLVQAGADIAKFAVKANDILDNLRVLRVLQRAKHPTIALCMGELGVISRILGRKYGNFLTFASLAAGRESAPGQLTAEELRVLYRYQKIGPKTALYGVIANPVAHSMSPAIQNAAFEALGLDAVYLPFKVEGDPAEFVRAFRELDAQGYSVTLPHKQTIIAAMDEVDETVRQAGAMNTVINRGGRLCGANTDIPAALGAIEEALGGGAPGPVPLLKGKEVLLIGAGGAARAVAYGLMARGAYVLVANRTHERAVALAREISAQAVPMDRIGPLRPQILINTTSVGMWPNMDESPLPAAMLRKGMIVFDAVYNPPETRLLRDAKAAGCLCVSGVEWFVRQAALQCEMWTGRPAPHEIMEDVVLKRLARTE